MQNAVWRQTRAECFGIGYFKARFINLSSGNEEIRTYTVWIDEQTFLSRFWADAVKAETKKRDWKEIKKEEKWKL